MNIHSNLRVSKTNEMDDRLTAIWNNLVTAMSVVNGMGLHGAPIVVNSIYSLLRYTTPELRLDFGNSLFYGHIGFRCDSSLVSDMGGALEIVAVTTSALEYVVDREDCIAIEEWSFEFGNMKDRYQDVGVGSIAEMMGINEERAIDLLEKHVEPKLDEIEQACL